MEKDFSRRDLPAGGPQDASNDIWDRMQREEHAELQDERVLKADLGLAGCLTPEQARTVALPSVLHPIERLRELNRLGNQTLAATVTGWSPFPLYATRRDLMRAAESMERARKMLDIAKMHND